MAHELFGFSESVDVDPQRVEYLAIGVQLGLFPGGVADAHRLAVAPSLEMRELAFAEIDLAPHAVHDLKRSIAMGMAPSGGHYPVDEISDFIGAASDPECFQGEAGIADPREPIVPVALTPDHLGQRCGRGRHDRAGWSERESFEHARRQLDQVTRWSFVDVMLGFPRTPRRLAILQGTGHVSGGRGLGRG